MATLYFDTSALVKLYLVEQGSDVVIGLASDQSFDRLAILDLSLVEFRSMVRRRERAREISSDQAELIVELVEAHASSTFLVQSTTREIQDEARRLLDTRPLRTLDALQLAGCLSVRVTAVPPLTFVCADTRLCEAASLEGIDTINPLDG